MCQTHNEHMQIIILCYMYGTPGYFGNIFMQFRQNEQTCPHVHHLLNKLNNLQLRRLIISIKSISPSNSWANMAPYVRFQ